MLKRKRSCEENFAPQLKTHVNNKIMQMNNQEQMKLIYDKTRQLLFSGAKNSNKNNTEYNNNSNKKINENSDNSTRALVERKLGTATCCCNSNWKCYFCDKLKCNDCIVQCVKCENIFCRDCSLVIYNQLGETYICMSCM